MNREQAKICMNFLDAKSTRIMFPDFNIDCYGVMCQWANGERLLNYLVGEPSFCASLDMYKFKQETHIINNIEVPAPYRVEPKIDVIYYSISNTGVIESDYWDGWDYDISLFKIGNCFKSHSDAEQNSKAHWGQS